VDVVNLHISSQAVVHTHGVMSGISLTALDHQNRDIWGAPAAKKAHFFMKCGVVIMTAEEAHSHNLTYNSHICLAYFLHSCTLLAKSINKKPVSHISNSSNENELKEK